MPHSDLSKVELRDLVWWGEFVRAESVGHWGRDQERLLVRLREAHADAAIDEKRDTDARS
jgi:hypothetical protein